jgi:hypothetical protein
MLPEIDARILREPTQNAETAPYEFNHKNNNEMGEEGPAGNIGIYIQWT